MITPLSAFSVVVALAFMLCLAVGMHKDNAAEFFLAGRDLPFSRNTLALSGDYINTTALLSAIGASTLSGFDGMYAVVSFAVGLCLLLLVAEPLRTAGGFTLGDILEGRMPGPSTRIAAAVVTFVVTVPLAVIQLSVAGDATAYVLGWERDGVAELCTVLMGLLIVMFAAFGGMHGVTMIQVGKMVLVFGVLLALTAAVARRADWDLGAVIDGAGEQGGGSNIFYAPGQLFGAGALGRLDLGLMALTIALGSAMFPHVLMRINTFREPRQARRGTLYALVGITVFAGATVLVGLSSAATVGSRTVVAEEPLGYWSLFMLTDHLSGGSGGGLLFTLVACVVFLTALSTASALILASAAAFAHDLYGKAKRQGEHSDERVVKMARWAIVSVGLLSVCLAVMFRGSNLVSLTVYVETTAASTILPAVLYRLFWSGFTRQGLLVMLYGSLASSTVLQCLSTAVSGNPYSLLPAADFALLPLHNVAAVTIPLGFLLGWAGSRASRRSSGTGVESERGIPSRASAAG